MTYRYLTTFPPEMNDGNHVFVFGSNLAGVHGAGAARQASRFWGARRGRGSGPYDHSYAIPTKKTWRSGGLPLPFIQDAVLGFIFHARLYPEITFLVSPIGTGFAGYTHAQIAPLFKGAPPNCVFISAWKQYLE